MRANSDRPGRRARLRNALRIGDAQHAVAAHAGRRISVGARHPHVGDVVVRQRGLIERGRDRRGPGIVRGQLGHAQTRDLRHLAEGPRRVGGRCHEDPVGEPVLAELAPDDVEVAVDRIDDDDRRLIEGDAGRDLCAVRPARAAVIGASDPDVAVRIVAAAEERRVGDVDHARLDRLRGRRAVRARREWCRWRGRGECRR